MKASLNRKEKHAAKWLLSLIATPLIIFISTSIPLYTKNQIDLGHQIHVLFPFLILFACVWIVGALIWRWRNSGVGRTLLWTYYLIGPLFLAFTIAHDASPQLFDSPGVLSISAVVACALIVFAVWKKSPQRATPFFAALSALLLAVDMFRVTTDIDWTSHGGRQQSTPKVAASVSAEKKPNIYHLILDGFQSDIFSSLLTEKLKKELNGFTYYPETTALYSHTTWSVPSVFLGAAYDESMSPAEYQERALASEHSMLHTIKEVGYSTLAYTRKLYAFDLKLFDDVIQHVDNMSSEQVDNTKAFVGLWIYRHAPTPVKNWLATRALIVDRKAIEQFQSGTFLTESAPVESLQSFQRYLETEHALPASNRYTFIHLLLPHDPYVFGAKCAQQKQKATPQSQSSCAARLIVRLVKKLKELKRFEDALIIVHGDHGDKFEMRDGKLEPINFRSPRTLLLIKPPAVNDGATLRIVPAEASLLDVAPTLLSFVNASAREEFVGLALQNAADASLQNRQRQFFEVRSDSLLLRYAIKDGKPIFEQEVKVKNAHKPLTTEELNLIPIFEPHQIVEAEDGKLSASVDVRRTIADASGRHISSGTAQYRFQIKEAGTYRLRVRAITPSGNNDSCFVRIDDEEKKLWHMQQSRQWLWQENPLEFRAKPGPHLISIEYREPIFIDQLELKKS